jgi:phenylacetate-CoA ligase
MQTAFTGMPLCNRGGHLQPDLLIVELLDDHENPVCSRLSREVTITTLGLEAMPLLSVIRPGTFCIAHT